MKELMVKLAIPILAAGGLMTGCFESDGGRGDSLELPTDYELEQTNLYTISGDTLSLISPEQIMSWSYCYDDSLIASSDTFPMDTFPLQFQVSGNELSLTYFEVTDSILSSTEDTVIFTLRMILSRLTGASGLIGRWLLNRIDYVEISGQLTQTDIKHLDIFYGDSHIEQYEYGFNSDGTVDVKANLNFSVWYVNNFIEFWNEGFNNHSPSDSSIYDITVEKINDSTVRLTGRITNELVTISWNTDGDGPYNDDVTYSSSVSTHATRTIYDNPTTCPNEPPAWYDSFLTMNAKVSGIGKKSVNMSKQEALWKKHVHQHSSPLPFFHNESPQN